MTIKLFLYLLGITIKNRNHNVPAFTYYSMAAPGLRPSARNYRMGHFKLHLTEEMIVKFAGTLTGWDKSIYEFGLAFSSLSKNFNYGSRDPIKSINDIERDKLYCYIKEYHNNEFQRNFSLNELIPILPLIIDEISNKLKMYMEKL